MSEPMIKLPRELAHEAEVATPHLIKRIRQFFLWGRARGLTRENGATIRGQVNKLMEEAGEIADAWENGDIEGVQDGIGDSLVVLVQIAKLAGVSLDTGADKAWKDIKDRKGKLCHGIFVKQADIDAFAETGRTLDMFRSVDELVAGLESLKC